MGLMDLVGFGWSNDLLVQDRNDTPCAWPNSREALGLRGNVGNCRRNPALKTRLIWKNKIMFMEVRYIVHGGTVHYIYIYTLYISNQPISLSICLKWYGYSGWHFCCHPPPKIVIICAHVKLRIMFAKFRDENFPRFLGTSTGFLGP